ncbi:LLM class F420-dependent oxidoreductase [Pseudonocardia sp. T1-2H]|uniref:LLM class F420-dependent oxidoreductase n=1 Tax=Pseudonocardia sp. T1-2H TaxID=3128899 RepID=UPI003100CC45
MEFGVVTFLTDYGIAPLELGRAVEQRGFGSLFLTEHTHIPTSRRSPWPGGAELPRKYWHTYDPFVALGAIAAVTERIALGTGVSLINQHHPITLAKAVASVDRLSGGRFELGVGPGWNVEEMANHGANPGRRTAEMLERLEAMRLIWTQDEPEFHGEFVDFDPIWSWPKPLRVPPVLIGGGGPTVLDRVLSHGDGWIPLRIPLSGLDEFGRRIAELRERAAKIDKPVTVTVYGAAPKPAALESYAAAGVDRVLFELQDHEGAKETLTELDALAELAR